LQTRRLATSFEGLNSSLVQMAEELCSWQGNCISPQPIVL